MHSADPLCLLGWCGSRSGPPTSQPPTAPLKSDPDTNNLEVSFDVTSLKISICLVWQFGVCCIHLNFLQALTHFKSKKNGRCLPPRKLTYPIQLDDFPFPLVGYVSSIDGLVGNVSQVWVLSLGYVGVSACLAFNCSTLCEPSVGSWRPKKRELSSPRSWKPKWTKERTSNEPKVQLDVPQGSLYYESKQGTKKVEIPQNYFSFALLLMSYSL